MKYIHIYRLLALAVLLHSCEVCECLDENISTPPPPPIEVCEGIFYHGALSIEPDGTTPLTFEGFNFPASNPLQRTSLETQNVNLFGEFFSSAFGAYDTNNNRYAFFYLLDDSDAPNTLYLSDPNAPSSVTFETPKDQAAPVFLNGNLYTINLLSAAPNVEFEILEMDQSSGISTQVAASFAVVDGVFNNALISSATNGIDTIYFLGLKTLISYNVATNTVLTQDINIPYDADIQTALSGLEYRGTTNELIAIHHKLNNPDAIERLVSINTESGEVAFLFNIEANLGTDNNGDIEYLTNSTTYSACEDIYYITEIVDSETSESPNSFLIAIDIPNSTLTEIETPDFLYGITLDEEL